MKLVAIYEADTGKITALCVPPADASAPSAGMQLRAGESRAELDAPAELRLEPDDPQLHERMDALIDLYRIDSTNGAKLVQRHTGKSEPECRPSNPSLAEIEAFAAKFAKWSESLPAAQRSLAHVLVEHARELTPRSVALSRITGSLRDSVRAVIDTLNLRAVPQAWARVDPIWEKRNEVPLGEDVEIVQRVFFKGNR